MAFANTWGNNPGGGQWFGTAAKYGSGKDMFGQSWDNSAGAQLEAANIGAQTAQRGQDLAQQRFGQVMTLSGA